jgi:hypothetical protein
MEKRKRLVLFTALSLATATLAFAQTSNTNKATMETFRTDTDMFMDVNDWNTVKPKTLFGYTGFSHNTLNLGLAKQFKNFYTGVYFNGNLWSGNSATEHTETTGSIENHTFTSGSSSNSASVLFGIKNWGFKGAFNYSPNASSSTQNSNSTGSSTTDNQKYTMSFNLSAGTNVPTKNITFKPHASFSFFVIADKTTTKTTTNGTTTADTMSDAGYSGIGIGLGSGFVFPEINHIRQSATFDTSFAFNFYPLLTDSNTVADTSTKIIKTGNKIVLIPSYLVETKPVDKLGINVKLSAPVSFDNTFINSQTVTTGTTPVSTPMDEDINEVIFSPAAALGLQYAAIPDKLLVNSGFSVTIPSFTYKNDNKKAAGQQTQSWNYDSVTTTASFGFAFFFAKDICASTTMNLFSYSNASSKQTGEMSTSLSSIWTSSVSFDFAIKL